MDLSTWLIFSNFALICVISPGPAVILSVTNSLTHGLAKSVFSSLGNITGIMLVSGAAAFGLGALLQASVVLFGVLKCIGAVYLIYLGIRQWRSKANLFAASEGADMAGQGRGKLFVRGLLVALSNPKAVLFFTALLPQFIDLSRPVAIQFTILTTTFMTFSFIALVIYALCARSTQGWFAGAGRALWFNRISGAVFVAFGLGMLRFKNRSA